MVRWLERHSSTTDAWLIDPRPFPEINAQLSLEQITDLIDIYIACGRQADRTKNTWHLLNAEVLEQLTLFLIIHFRGSKNLKILSYK